jgi:hemerythrin-like domain-containing protein
MHHGIEEAHIFPYLARRMPAFRKELELLEQHKKIHKGLDRFEDYLKECRDGERDFSFPEMKTRMDAFGKVLWEHLDDEVRQLGANEMRKYWSVKEVQAFPFL